MSELDELVGLLEQGPGPELALEPDEVLAAPAGPVPSDDPDDWSQDPVAMKLEKIRSVFLNSKSPLEVRMAAATMPIGLWLEQVVRLMPKDIKVQGEVEFRHMLADLGPIDKDAYRLAGPAQPLIEEAAYRVVEDGDAC